MAYVRTNWENNATALSATNMNNIEDGIEENKDSIETINGSITSINQAIQTEALKMQLLDVTYPVGSIYMSATLDTAAKVGTALGGTWEAWGSGKVPVGVDTAQTEFATVEKSGGAKTVTLSTTQMPSHSHTMNHSHSATGIKVTTPTLTANKDDYVHAPFEMSSALGTINSSSSASYRYLRMSASGITSRSIGRDAPSITSGKSCTVSGSVAHSGSTGNAGSGQAHNNLQPYITCYMYKRTA